MLRKLLIVVGGLAALWCALLGFSFTSPVVFLHYSATAAKPVRYFFNENDNTTKAVLKPGESVEFRTPHHPASDYFIEVSLPFASRDGVEIKQPFSRADVYIGNDTKIMRTVITKNYMARFAFE